MSVSVIDTGQASNHRLAPSDSAAPPQFSVKSNGASIAALAEEAGAFYLGKRTARVKPPNTNAKLQKARIEHTSARSDPDESADPAQQAGQGLSETISSVDVGEQSDADAADQASDWTSFDAYRERLTWLNEVRLAEIYEQLIDQAQDIETLWDLIRKQAKDVASQYAILLYSRKTTTQALSSSDYIEHAGWGRVAAASRLSQLLNRVIPEFEAEHQTHLQAALNTSAVVEAFVDAHQGHTGERLSEFYQDAVLDFASLGSLYELITERYGARRFGWATRFLNQALQADYDSVGPSLPKSRLRAIMNDLRQIQSLESVHLNASKLWRRLKSTYPGVNYRPSKLIKEVLEVQSSKVSNAHLFKQLLGALALTGASFNPVRARQYKVNLLTGVGEILRLIPPRCFQENTQQRTKLLKDLQQALDDAIAEEENKENRMVRS